MSNYLLNIETDCVVETFPGPLTRAGALEVCAEEDGFGLGRDGVRSMARAYGGLGHLILVCDGVEITD